MEATLTIVAWWIAFAGSHMVLSSVALRPRLVERLGAGPFQGLYSLVALATFIPLVRSYLQHLHEGPSLWQLTLVPGVRIVALFVSALAFAFVFASFFQPSPAGMVPGGEVRAHGLLRITRHPMFVPLGIWGAAHLLVNGYATDVAFFGGFVVFSVVGCAHQDARKRALEGDRLGAFLDETSLVPFAAIAAGRQRLVLAELPWFGLALGVGVSTAIYLAHPWMFGH